MMMRHGAVRERERGFSALQRAEIAEINANALFDPQPFGFSALQRAEIAEISRLEQPTQRRK